MKMINAFLTICIILSIEEMLTLNLSSSLRKYDVNVKDDLNFIADGKF